MDALASVLPRASLAAAVLMFQEQQQQQQRRPLRPFFTEQQAVNIHGFPLEPQNNYQRQNQVTADQQNYQRQQRRNRRGNPGGLPHCLDHLLRSAGVVTAPRVSEQQQRGGIEWLFQAARSHEARTGDSLNAPLPVRPISPSRSNSPAIPSPLVSPDILRSLHTGTGDPWVFTSLEDLVDDPLLFERTELQRRRTPAYRAAASKLHDLHIVLPIVVPGGTLVVEDVQGANFYRFPDGDRGASILFGRGVSERKQEQQVPSGVAQQGSPNDNLLSPSSSAAAASNSSGSSVVASPEPTVAFAAGQCDDDETSRPVCDVWGSFLNIRLGTIYNLSADQVGLVSDLFKSATFDRDLCRYYVPIAIDCRGVYPSKDDALSQRASRSNGRRENRFAARERYETRGVPASENDLKRLRMLRRHLRRLALRCISEFGFNNKGPGPQPKIEFHENITVEKLLKGTLKIVVREWSPLTHAPTFRQVWARKLSSGENSERRSNFSAEVESRVKQKKSIPCARVLAGEIRLEHSHLRMVDPRWPDDLVPGRRLADRCPEAEAPGPEGTLGRFVFCRQLELPPVEYSYLPAGEDPRGIAITSKLQTLYKVHLSRHPHAGRPKQTLDGTPAVMPVATVPAVAPTTGDTTTTTTTTTTTLDAVAAPFVPLLQPELDSAQFPASLRCVVLGQTEEPAPLDLSAVLPHAPPSPPSFQLCKFYFKNLGCARGASCKFWHPADESMSSSLDVRQVTPQHPKFF